MIRQCARCGGLYTDAAESFSGTPCKCTNPVRMPTNTEKLAIRDKTIAELRARVAELEAAVRQHAKHTISWANDLEKTEMALVPDEALCRFYQVASYADLVSAQARHIKKLQERARNIEPKIDFRVRIPREG